MRILWVKAGGLVPLDSGGKIRSFHTIRELARNHDVALYTFYEAHDNDVHGELTEILARVDARPLSLPKKRTLPDALLFARLLASGTAYTMGKFYTPEVRRELRALCIHGEFDVVVCDFLHPAGVLPWSGNAPTVLFTHNVEAEVWERQHRLTGNLVLKSALRLEAAALARAERRYAQLADHVIAVSERNADHFRAFLPAGSVSVVPTGVDIDYFAPTPGKPAASHRDIVFTGSMDWLPNDDSVRYFVADILPAIRRELPEARFWAVGKNPSSSLRQLADDQHVFVTGTVDDIRPYLSRASVFVVPMRSGSGTRLKIFEAMAGGKPVVSTTIGAEGLEVVDGDNIMIADEPADFAAAVVSLLRDRDAAERLGTAARQLVEDRYSWSAVALAFERILRRGIDAAKQRSRASSRR